MKFKLVFLLLISLKMSSQDSITYPAYFAYNIAEIDSMEDKRLSLLLRNFDSFSISQININAYCDERGGKKINDILSKNRAISLYKKIKSSLKKTDSMAFITAVGRGFLPLENKENVEDQRARNRRGDITIYYARIKKEDNSIAKGKPRANDPAVEDPKADLATFLDSAKIGEKIELKIFFEGGRSILLPLSFKELDSLAVLLKKSKVKINILGHIYANGYAQEIDGFDEDLGTNNLSETRAKKVFDYLITKGISKKRMSYSGLGGRFPRDLGPNRDRRVEIEIAE